MLTYATLDDYVEMHELNKTGFVADPTPGFVKIERYLDRATRFITRFTRREFFPFIETRKFPVPYAYLDLNIRRFPDAHLKLDQDLLEPLTVNNGVNDLTIDDDYFLLEHNIYPKTILAVKFPNFWGGFLAGLTPFTRYDEAIVTVDAIWGYFDGRYPDGAWIDTTEDLGSDLDATATSITFTNIDGEDEEGNNRVEKGRLLRIDDEFLEVTDVNISTNAATVRRGVRGSTATTHSSGADILKWSVIHDIVEATLKIAKAWREEDIQIGGAIGVSDGSASKESGIPNEPLSMVRSYQRSILYG